jgi:UDP-2-acetamido-3-amino-2,3-dideoxy-glucuronate N-acetyltransferase
VSEVYLHPSVEVDAGAEIGAGTKIWHWSHVMAGARIGTDCTLGRNVFVGQGVVIGDRVKIQNNVSVFAGVGIEDDAFIGPSAVFTNVGRPRSAQPVGGIYEQTLVRRGATIGANATIVCGVTLGLHSFVAAGAVVTHDVADHALVMGNPARFAGWVCSCGVALGEPDGGRLRCASCDRGYRLDGDTLREDTQ